MEIQMGSRLRPPNDRRGQNALLIARAQENWGGVFKRAFRERELPDAVKDDVVAIANAADTARVVDRVSGVLDALSREVGFDQKPEILEEELRALAEVSKAGKLPAFLDEFDRRDPLEGGEGPWSPQQRIQDAKDTALKTPGG